MNKNIVLHIFTKSVELTSGVLGQFCNIWNTAAPLIISFYKVKIVQSLKVPSKQPNMKRQSILPYKYHSISYSPFSVLAFVFWWLWYITAPNHIAEYGQVLNLNYNKTTTTKTSLTRLDKCHVNLTLFFKCVGKNKNNVSQMQKDWQRSSKCEIFWKSQKAERGEGLLETPTIWYFKQQWLSRG